MELTPHFYISYPCIAWIIFEKCSKGICQSMKSVKPSHWLVSRFCQNNFYCLISARAECSESLVGHGSFWEFQPQMTRRFPSISGCFGWDPSCIFLALCRGFLFIYYDDSIWINKITGTLYYILISREQQPFAWSHGFTQLLSLRLKDILILMQFVMSAPKPLPAHQLR